MNLKKKRKEKHDILTTRGRFQIRKDENTQDKDRGDFQDCSKVAGLEYKRTAAPGRPSPGKKFH